MEEIIFDGAYHIIPKLPTVEGHRWIVTIEAIKSQECGQGVAVQAVYRSNDLYWFNSF